MFPYCRKILEVMLLLTVKCILGDRTVEPIFINLGPMQSKPVDLVPSIDERKEVTNVQLIRGISSHFRINKIDKFFLKCEGFSGCFR